VNGGLLVLAGALGYLRFRFGHGQALGDFRLNLLSGGKVLPGGLKAVNLYRGPREKSCQHHHANQIAITHTIMDIGRARENLRISG
jgi:hypothetical protein